jgi:HAD superfamily hydrolase (TIGR01509 family)
MFVTLPSALIFDMDGLLVDSEPRSDLAMEQFLTRRMLDLDPELMPQLLGRRLPEAMVIVKDWYGLDDDAAAITVEFSELRLAALKEYLPVMPGARELVAWGREQQIPMALATSSRRAHADIAIAAAGLTGLFDAEATGDEVERGKPEPDLFLLAATRLGVAPAGVLVFEDAPAGVAAAKAAGMRVVWIPNDHSRDLEMNVKPDHQFDSLIEAREWLDAERSALVAGR